MSHTLTITDDSSPSEKAVIMMMKLPPIDPLLAVPAILAALAALPQPKPARKKRADAGATRKEGA